MVTTKPPADFNNDVNPSLIHPNHASVMLEAANDENTSRNWLLSPNNMNPIFVQTNFAVLESFIISNKFFISDEASVIKKNNLFRLLPMIMSTDTVSFYQLSVTSAILQESPKTTNS